MIFPESGWIKYIDTLAAINKTAAQKFVAYLNAHDVTTAAGKKAAIDYAYALATRYGEMAAAASCEMYDAVAEASGAILPAAEPAATATYGEVAKTFNGMVKQKQNNEAMGNAVGRLVKRTGADTVLQNAKRDGAECAWVPHGDTCSFCLMLASNGWQTASKKTIKGDHAEHIHANCDCTFAIRFDGKSGVAGYDPDRYREIYDNAEGNSWQEKLNSMRREEYAKNADKIRAQKREAYRTRVDRKNKTVYSGIPKSWQRNLNLSDDEVLRGTNPNYKDNLPGYLIGTNDDYKNNCTNCVVAYSVRKKGYIVTAKSVGECGTLRYNERLFTAWDGRTPTNASGTGLDDILKFMGGHEDGTLLAITVEMPDSVFNPLLGHAFVAEKRAGEVVFLDPQTGTRYNKPKVIFDAVQPEKTKFMRIDDLELSDRGISACKEA